MVYRSAVAVEILSSLFDHFDVWQNMCDLDASQRPRIFPIPFEFAWAAANTGRPYSTWCALMLACIWQRWSLFSQPPTQVWLWFLFEKPFQFSCTYRQKTEEVLWTSINIIFWVRNAITHNKNHKSLLGKYFLGKEQL